MGRVQILNALSSGRTGSNPAVRLYFHLNFFQEMSDDDIDDADLEQPEESEAAHLFGNILRLQMIRMLSWPKEKLGYVHVLLFTKDDDRRSALRTAQKTTIGEIMRGKEQSMDGKKRKQHVMDGLLASPSKQFVESSVMVSKSGSNEVDTKIASFFYERTAFLSPERTRAHTHMRR